MCTLFVFFWKGLQKAFTCLDEHAYIYPEDFTEARDLFTCEQNLSTQHFHLKIWK